MQAEYMVDILPTGEDTGTSRTNVKDAWEVFQAYAAYMVGAAFGLDFHQRSSDLRVRDEAGRSMVGQGMELYYDTRPAPTLLPSWRDETDRPGDERPDIVLVDRVGDRVAILDAKFRVESHSSGHRVHSGDLQEMQGYMQSFGLSAGAIVYPGSSPARIHSASDNTLLELPLNPKPEDFEVVLEGIRDALDHIWVHRTAPN